MLYRCTRRHAKFNVQSLFTRDFNVENIKLSHDKPNIVNIVK